MTTCSRSAHARIRKQNNKRYFHPAPLAHAVALIIATGAWHSAHAQQAFSSAWFAAKGAAQSTAASTGYLPNGMPASSLTNPALQQQKANQQLQTSLNNLVIVARGIAAQQAAQQAARQAAMNGSSVPDGLADGGLKVDTNSLTKGWLNAMAPTQGTADGKTTVAIQQTADKAILNWETFNVGKNTILSFLQLPHWAVLNRVNDPLARPSQIQGQIKGDGTVMIVNRNGIIFSGSSQVDTRNLVAAAANISDTQFTSNGLYGATQTTASFTDANGKLIVEAGAQIATTRPASVTQGGGYVLLLGSEVSNAGQIATNRGQAELAAGDSFIIRKGVGTEGNTISTTRGNEIAPQFKAGSTAGKVSNSGLIVAREGDVTLAGRDVQQNGVAVASTTVNTRGTIHLLNSSSDTQGKVTLGAGATTAIVIEDDGVTTALNSQRDALISESAAQDLLRANSVAGSFDNLAKLSDRRDQSRIEIVSGGNVEFQGDSTTLATGGQIVVSAAKRSFVADKAVLDVSGAVGVNLAMDVNNLKINVQGNELRDAPGNRDSGNLLNGNLWIDTRQLIYVPAGTGGYASERWYTAGGLLEVGGYLGNQGHRVGEWAAQGGSILLGGAEVVTQAGSSVNLSGGTLNVQTGYLNQSWLKGADGQLYNASTASSNILYTGMYKGFEDEHVRWGKNATGYYYNPLIGPQLLLQNGYTVGRDAGRLIVNAPTAVLEGNIVADVYNGPQQTSMRTGAAGDADGYKFAQSTAARAGMLALGRYAAVGRADLFNTDVRIGNVAQTTLGMAADDALDPARTGTFWLDSQRLNAQALGGLDLGTRGAIVIDQVLTLADGGQLNMIGANIDIRADVTIHSGSLRGSNLFTSPVAGAPVQALVQNGTSLIALRDGATLDLRGRQSSVTQGDGNGQAYVNGGSVALESSQGVTVERGSLIDVSSGAAILAKGKQKGGKGGNVSLIADSATAGAGTGGALQLDGEVRAYGVSGGGTFKIETGNAVAIGGDPALTPAALNIDASRLQSGFSSIDINGHQGLNVAAGAQLDVASPVYRFSERGEVGALLAVWTPPQQQDDALNQRLVQRAGADLILRSQRLLNEGGNITVGAGAVISVDPGRSISLLGGGMSNIVVDGRLNAWGGNIAIGIDAPAANGLQSTSQHAHQRSVWIGDSGVLDVAARAVTVTAPNGRRYGTVRDGGTIAIGGALDWESKGEANAPDIAVIIRPGALLDASGTSAVLDFPGFGKQNEVTVASNGGSIILKSAHSLYLDGTLRARAGGAGAAGGTLAIALERLVFANNAQPDDAVRSQREFILSQTQQGSGLSATLQPGQFDPALVYGAGRLGVDQIGNGGFGNLSLLVDGALSFAGDVDLATSQSMRLYAGSYGLSESAAASSQVKLASSYLRLAAPTRIAKDNDVMFGVTWRNGSSTRASDSGFAIEADLIDIRDRVGFGMHGQVRQQNGSMLDVDRRGFDAVDLVSRGDVRLLTGATGLGLSGNATTELATTGDMSITAAQIYPATGVNAQIVAGYDAGRVLNIRRYGDTAADPAMPLSVFGSLTLGANIVRQGGVVRAPMGDLLLGTDSRGTSTAHASLVELLPGSLTSVSGAGVVMPYGGTIDGVTYDYAGKPIVLRALGASGITLTGDSVVGRGGSVLDLSGGGELTGAGFISGRGGSVDIIRTPLVNANPTLSFSKSGNAVYAIVPGSSAVYAPMAADAGAADPMIGRQITLDSDVGGLKAGTYTLMPSTYALLPGAFRVEVGAAITPGSGVAASGNGSYIAPGYLSVANSAIRSSLPNQLILTQADAVRKQSTYNETDYNAFVVADAARRGGIRGEVSDDARSLSLDFGYSRPQPGVRMLQFDGTARFRPASGGKGFGGTLSATAFDLEVLADGAMPSAGFTGASLYASDLNAFNASRMILGGSLVMQYGDNFATFKSNTSNLTVRSGAKLNAAEVFLLSGSSSGGIAVEQGASINTIGRGAAAFDSASGVVFSAGTSGVLALSNGWINLLPPNASSGLGSGTIDIGKCNAAPCSGETTLYSEGTLAIATEKSFTMADNARYGSKNLLLAVSSLNMGSDAALGNAAQNGVLPTGLSLNQDVLNRLLAGNAGVGAPAVESLIFNVRESVNMYGSVNLDTRNPVSGKSSIQRLVVGTPAIYGYGSATDKANISTEEFIWTGSTAIAGYGTGQYSPAMPGAAIGSLLGDSTLNISAARILFGYGPNTQPLAGISTDRLALGFGTINLNASERVTANGTGTLKVYHQQGAYVAGQGYQNTGGDLNIVAPMLTGEAASVNRITAGGALTVSAPAGISPAVNSDALGAELQLSGRSVNVNTAVVLPSGNLSLSATDDLTLGDNARFDLSGRAIKFFEQTRYSWGGDLSLSSSEGNILQGTGSLINLSAHNNRAGTLKATAFGVAAGRIDLAGSILGATSGRYDAGGTIVPYDAAEVTVRAQTLGDFAGLNARLNSGGVFGARRFQIKQGDLVIGDEVKARQVEVTVDGGKLTVNGRIDASGFQVGSIRLASRDDLIVNGVLDAHATGLRVDSYGKIIDSANRAIVDLTTQGGMLTLGRNAAVDLRVGTETAMGNDGVARGTFSLNAPRLGGSTAGGAGAGANDVAITVTGAPFIAGAKTIAVNAFRSYDDAPLAQLPDVSGNTPQLITQAYLDGIDVDSQAYIIAALANTNLSGRLAGLGPYHLRPGVEIVSNKISNPGGDLSVSGDLDLSGYRYGPGSNRLDPNLRGYGEPGVLVLRAAGNLNIYGSINDGFAPPPATPDDKGWYLTEGRVSGSNGMTPFGGDIVIPVDGIVLEAGTVFPKNATLNYDLPVAGLILPGGTVLPVDVTLNGSHTLPVGTVLAANVYNADGSVALAAGTVLRSNVVLNGGMKLGAGLVLRSDANVAALTWPKGVALPVDMTAGGSIALARGALIPAMTKVELLNDTPVSLRPETGGVQGANWAVAPMLGQGSTSWGLQLTAGADLSSSNRRAVMPGAKGSIILADTHSMTNVLFAPGGTGLVWSDLAGNSGLEPGTPVDQFYVDLGICDPAAGLCVIDPKRISYTWGPDGVNWDPSFVEGTPVEQWAIDSGYCSFISCTQIVSPVRDVTTYTLLSPMFSVVRTGSGDLDINAARDFRMQSPFGVYTAGTRSAALTDVGGIDRYNQPRSLKNGSPIGIPTGDYSAALADYQAWYPEQGGNLSLNVGGDVVGDTWGVFQSPQRSQTPSASVGNWLWRQGTGSTATGAAAIPTAWWINFGTYVSSLDAASTTPYLIGFTGLGTLGGGNLSIDAGGNAGILASRGDVGGAVAPRSQALVAAVGSTGRVGDDGSLILTGGGDLRIRVGGAVNANLAVSQYGSGGANGQNQDLNGALINLRGTTSLAARAIGGIQLRYRQLQSPFVGADGDAAEVRAIDPFTSTIAVSGSGLTVVPGDSAVYLDTLGDLVLSTAADAGRVFSTNTSAFTTVGTRYSEGGQSWFSLWTPHTAINLFAAGGNLTPGTDIANRGSAIGNTNTSDVALVYPSILRATAATGSVYYGYSAAPISSMTPTLRSLVLAPSANGALEFLAGTSLYGGSYPISMSGADTPLPTPFHPAFAGYDGNSRLVPGSSNLSLNGSTTGNGGYDDKVLLGAFNRFPLFAFGPDTVGATALHAGDPSAALFYAVNGDVIGLSNGNVQTYTPYTERTIPVWYRSATAARVLAGRDIVNSNGLFVHNNSTDISLVQAGRDILYANIQVAGPGTLEVSAGRNLLQEGKASIVSIGALVQGDSRPGADIAMMAGMGAGGLDFSAIAKRYLNPANLADANTALARQPGKVFKTYTAELDVWLKDRYGFQGNQADALAYFNALAPEQQRVFLRSVYYAELREGGREYNNPDSRRYGSFLRSRDMIATLFPDRDAAGNEIRRSGDITMFGNAGVHTNFGGDIQMMAPGGQIVIGVQGEVPQSTAGVVTQGQGNIQLFSERSLLLGLSRVMTTFGGDIFAWSEQGDINAGRGSKTTVLYTPPKRVYDQWGNVTVSPQVPSSGAGIATLSPVPEAKAGDVDLIAPLGTIDAGEAGIRVSGNINIFALEVVNATNIQVKGESAGIPVVAAVNVGALSNASAAASSAASAAQDTVARARSEARQALPSIFTVRVLGFGNDAGGDTVSPISANGVKSGYDSNSFVQIAGHGNQIKPELMSRLTEEEKRKLLQDQ